MNRDTTRALEYHDLTKHSYWSIRTRPHFLDWNNQPAPFKLYPDIEPIYLPSRSDSSTAALDALRGLSGKHQAGQIDFALLANLLFYSAGVTKTKTYPGGTIYFRAAACAGALYPIEVYLVCRTLEGLPAGVYHFNPGDFALRRLRDGDYSDILVRAAGLEEQLATAPVVFVYTAMSWRSSWKYLDRAYRYHYWDCGMILANMFALGSAFGLSTKVFSGFVESEINKLLGIDGQRELALALLPVACDQAPIHRTESSAHLTPVEISFGWQPLSESEIDFSPIRDMHAASSLTSTEQVAEWRRTSVLPQPENSKEAAAPLARVAIKLPGKDDLPVEPLEDMIMRRASTRRFALKPLPFDELSLMLDIAVRPITADFLDDAHPRVNDIYLIANRVTGLESGSYVYSPEDGVLELLRKGEFSDRASYLALDQELGGDASATLFFMVNLDDVLRRFGNRGYRVAQLEAGIMGGRIYLSAYALGRGATGLTFYDDDVTEFFSPHAAGKSCMIVTSVGIPGKRPLF